MGESALRRGDTEVHYDVRLHSPYNGSVLVTSDLALAQGYVDNYGDWAKNDEIFIVERREKVVRKWNRDKGSWEFISQTGKMPKKGKTDGNKEED